MEGLVPISLKLRKHNLHIFCNFYEVLAFYFAFMRNLLNIKVRVYNISECVRCREGNYVDCSLLKNIPVLSMIRGCETWRLGQFKLLELCC